MTETSDNVLLIDKPIGLSSFDVIRILRRRIGLHKIGHAGTLDPLASGLLIVAIGDATKKLKELIGLDKTYEAEILLGRRTETGDMEGKVIEKAEVVGVEADRVRRVLESMEGEIELDAPIYSALKVKGAPMYKLARRGEKIEPKKRKMKIHSLKLLTRRPISLTRERAEEEIHGFVEGLRLRSVNKSPLPPEFVAGSVAERGYILKVELRCGSGTYVRSVAEEIGRRLGLPACVYSLRRMRIGDFRVEDAMILEKGN